MSSTNVDDRPIHRPTAWMCADTTVFATHEQPRSRGLGSSVVGSKGGTTRA